ncbi:MAG TPA: SLC13 family permease [Methylomirabilota bacterium]|jgi:anion transporter|nr:SLC13 family permease [Methylomirabilota bacterium]
MDAVVTTLRTVSLFAELPREVLARLVSEFDEVEVPAGRAVFSQGDPGDALYVVVSGAVEVRGERGGPGERVAVLGPGDCLGEMALVTGDPRSATVVALSPTRLLRLGKDRFQALSERHPVFLRELARVLCRRIARTTEDVAYARRAYTTVFDGVLTSSEPPARRLLEVLAVADRADGSVLTAILGEAGPRLAAEAAARHPALVVRDEKGTYRLHGEFRDHVRRRLGDESGADGTGDLHVALAAAHAAEGAWTEGARHWLAAGRWGEAAHAIHRALASGTPPPDAELETWLERLPEDVLLRADLGPAKASLLVRTGRPDAAGTLLERAFSGHRLDSGARDRLVRSLGALYAHRGQPTGETARRAGQEQAARAPSPRGPLSAVTASGARWGSAGLLLALAVAALVLWLPPGGLEPRAVRFLAVLAAGTVLWAWASFPDYVVALGMGIAWVLLRVAPTATAFAGFATSTWFLMLGILGLAAALARSGLLYRITLVMVRHFPPTFAGQASALLTAGIVSTVLIPSAQARVTFMGPVVLGLVDTLKYPPRSRASTGLALAAFTGFVLATTIFLTGTPTCLLAWRVLPEATRAQVSWLTWLQAVLVLESVSLGTALAWIVWRHRPTGSTPVRPTLLHAQLEMLGPPSREERITAFVALVVLVGWITQPWHGVDPAWLTLAGLCLLLATQVLDRTALQAQVDWSFLLFMGMAFSLADLAAHVGADAWFAARARAALGVVTTPAAAITVAVLITVTVRFALPWQTAVPLLTVALTPFAQATGLSPLIMGLVALKVGNLFLLPQQSPYYLTLYYGTEERAFGHRDARPFAWVYAAAVLAGFLLSLPYWRALGLVTG